MASQVIVYFVQPEMKQHVISNKRKKCFGMLGQECLRSTMPVDTQQVASVPRQGPNIDVRVPIRNFAAAGSGRLDSHAFPWIPGGATLVEAWLMIEKICVALVAQHVLMPVKEHKEPGSSGSTMFYPISTVGRLISHLFSRHCCCGV